MEQSGSFTPARRGLLFGLLCLAMALVMAFLLLFRYSLRSPVALDSSLWQQQTPEGFAWECDVSVEGGALTLRGWACVEGERMLDLYTWAVLYDTQTGGYLRLPTTTELDTRPNEILGGDILYDRAGFVSITPLSKLNGLAGYELCIAYGSNGHSALVHTGIGLEG